MWQTPSQPCCRSKDGAMLRVARVKIVHQFLCWTYTHTLTRTNKQTNISCYITFSTVECNNSDSERLISSTNIPLSHISHLLEITISLHFNSHFPAGHGLASTRMSPFWILLELRMMEVVATTGAVRRAKLQSNHHHQQTNTQHFTGQMPFLSPNQQCQGIEGSPFEITIINTII